MLRSSLPDIHHSAFRIHHFSCRDVAAQITEAVAELVRRHVAGARELLDPERVGEVVRLKADHVLARDAVALALRVDHSDARAARARLAYVGEGDWHHAPALYADHRVAAAGAQKADGRVAEVAAVGGVERDRVGAA